MQDRARREGSRAHAVVRREILDDKPEHFFAQFATDPQEFFKVYTDFKIPPDQLDSRGNTIVPARWSTASLAKKFGWKIGDRIVLSANDLGCELELTIRGIFKAPSQTKSIYFDRKVSRRSPLPILKIKAARSASWRTPQRDVPKVATAIDDMFHNSPQQTKTESEKAFGLDFVAMLGNVKAFILSICGAVVFATLLVSANTMAMSIRERTREVAVLKTLGFTRKTVLALFVGEAVIVAVDRRTDRRGLVGVGLMCMRWPQPAGRPSSWASMQVSRSTMTPGARVWRGLVGFVASMLPSYNASRVDIVEGLRHIG